MADSIRVAQLIAVFALVNQYNCTKTPYLLQRWAVVEWFVHGFLSPHGEAESVHLRRTRCILKRLLESAVLQHMADHRDKPRKEEVKPISSQSTEKKEMCHVFTIWPIVGFVGIIERIHSCSISVKHPW